MPDRSLNVSVVPVSYNKGSWVAVPDLVDFEYWDDVISSPTCQSEDVNNNGILDQGEDFNADGQLTPGNVASVPRTVQADENGIATFDLTYTKDICTMDQSHDFCNGFCWRGLKTYASREYSTLVSGEYTTQMKLQLRLETPLVKERFAAILTKFGITQEYQSCRKGLNT